jgi:hypothetical protein
MKLKPIGIKKRSKKQVYDGTKDFIDKVINGLVKRPNNTGHWDARITAEEVAEYLRVKTHLVKHALHKLNLEGVVSKPSHLAPHDSSRDPWGGGYDSSWQASIYRILL